MHNDKCSPKHNTPTACDSTVSEYECNFQHRAVGGQNVADLPLNFATTFTLHIKTDGILFESPKTSEVLHFSHMWYICQEGVQPADYWLWRPVAQSAKSLYPHWGRLRIQNKCSFTASFSINVRKLWADSIPDMVHVCKTAVLMVLKVFQPLGIYLTVTVVAILSLSLMCERSPVPLLILPPEVVLKDL